MQRHVKMGEGGRLIIPASYRKALNLHIGDELVLRLEDGELRLYRQSNALKNLRSIAKSKSKHKNHTNKFIAFRKKDSE